MRYRRWTGRAVTGLAAGALLTAALLGLFEVGVFLSLPSVGFTVFEWLIRVLPGRLVDLRPRTHPARARGPRPQHQEHRQDRRGGPGLTSLFVVGSLIGLLFFSLVRSNDPLRVSRYGRAVGAVARPLLACHHLRSNSRRPALANVILVTIWILGLFQLWGWGLAMLYLRGLPAEKVVRKEEAAAQASGEAAGPTPARVAGSVRAQRQPSAAGPVAAEVTRIDRRRFFIRVGGLVATIAFVGHRVDGDPARRGRALGPARGQGTDPVSQRRLTGQACPGNAA